MQPLPSREVTLRKSPGRIRCGLRAGFFVCAILVASPAVPQACTAVIEAAITPAVTAIMADIAAKGIAVTLGFTNLLSAMTKLANQGSNNGQNDMHALSAAVADHENTASHANEVAKTRVEVATQMRPSRVTCQIVSQQRVFSETEAQYRTARVSMQDAGTKYSLNGPGTPGEKGTLAALNWAFQNRCNTYADAAALGSPPGCAGASDPALIDLDITPQKSIFSAYTYASAELRQGALDSVTLLTESAPPDPLRGAALSRTEGRNIQVNRLRDLTRMNMARDILQDAVALRSEASTAATDGRQISRLSRLVELMVGNPLSDDDHHSATMSTLATQIQQEAVTASGETENANVQALAAKLTAQKMMLTEMLRMTEQMIAVAAINLAADVESSRTSNTSVNSRTLVR